MIYLFIYLFISLLFNLLFLFTNPTEKRLTLNVKCVKALAVALETDPKVAIFGEDVAFGGLAIMFYCVFERSTDLMRNISSSHAMKVYSAPQLICEKSSVPKEFSTRLFVSKVEFV